MSRIKLISVTFFIVKTEMKILSVKDFYPIFDVYKIETYA
jgi:hypothetical protein